MNEFFLTNWRIALDKKQKGFSLTELLVTMLVVSLVIAAMVPVMTKKYRENLGGYQKGKTQNSVLLTNVPSGGINIISGNTENVISYTTEQGVFEFKNTTSAPITLNLDLQGAGGGGGGYIRKTGNALVPSAVGTVYYWYVPAGVHNVQITKLTGGGGGGGGGHATASTAPDLSTVTSPTITCNDAKGICTIKDSSGNSLFEMSQYNAGDTNFPIPSTVTSWSPSNTTACTAASSNMCCWTGGTTAATNCTATGYSACTRTVCQNSAAQEICSKSTYDGGGWSLLTKEQLALIAKLTTAERISRAAASGGNLQLCNSLSGSSPPYCGGLSSACYGSDGTRCNPGYFWSSTANGSKFHYYYMEFGGLFEENTPSIANPTSPYSARCVRGGASFSPYGASGGGAGAGLSSPITISDVRAGDRLVVYIGAGGTGRDKSYTKGDDGNNSFVAHQRLNSAGTIWEDKATYAAGGGAGGASATASAASTSTTIGGTMSGGVTGGFGGAGSTTSGGGGGSSGGSGGTSSGANGGSGSNAGSGGGGGFATQSGGTTTYGTGGNGANGELVISYDYATTGGGGGAGGYHKDLTYKLLANTTLKITVGQGGAGGTITTSATQAGSGGNTFIGNTWASMLYGAQGGYGGISTPISLGSLTTTSTTNLTSVLPNYGVTTVGTGGAVGKIYNENAAPATQNTEGAGGGGEDSVMNNVRLNGGNGGISLSQIAINPLVIRGGCGYHDTPYTFSGCTNYTPDSPVGPQVYKASKGYGGNGGGGAGCNMNTCANGANGGGGFVFVSW